MKRRIRYQGITIFIALLLMVVFYKLFFPHRHNEAWDKFLDIFGITLILFGFLLRISARGYKQEKSPEGKKLIKHGPYAMVRNPMYLGTLMIGCGIIFSLFKLWLLMLFLTVFFLIYTRQVNKEERYLSRLFPGEYQAYLKATPKYFPTIRNLLRIHNYIPLKLSWVKRELLSLAIISLTLVFGEIWQDAMSFGYKQAFEEAKAVFTVIAAFLIIACVFIRKSTSSSPKV